MSEIQTFENRTCPKSGRNFGHPKCLETGFLVALMQPHSAKLDCFILWMTEIRTTQIETTPITERNKISILDEYFDF